MQWQESFCSKQMHILVTLNSLMVLLRIRFNLAKVIRHFSGKLLLQHVSILKTGPWNYLPTRALYSLPNEVLNIFQLLSLYAKEMGFSCHILLQYNQTKCTGLALCHFCVHLVKKMFHLLQRFLYNFLQWFLAQRHHR